MKKCPICKEAVSCRMWRYGTKMCSKCDSRYRTEKKKLELKNNEKKKGVNKK